LSQVLLDWSFLFSAAALRLACLPDPALPWRVAVAAASAFPFPEAGGVRFAPFAAPALPVFAEGASARICPPSPAADAGVSPLVFAAPSRRLLACAAPWRARPAAYAMSSAD
jgi:hypothetical protein